MYPQFGHALTSLYPSFTSCLTGPPYLRSTENAKIQNRLPSSRQATDKGEGLSKAFEDYAAPFGFADWPQFHKTWTAVRTRFIDDCIRNLVTNSTTTKA